MKKKPLILISILIVLIGIVVAFFVYFNPSLYNQYIKNKKTDAIFISAIDTHGEIKYGMIAYFRKDTSICDKLERPYRVLLPEQGVEFQRDVCRGTTKDIAMVRETFKTKDVERCSEQSAFRQNPNDVADGLVTTTHNGFSGEFETACPIIATAKDFDAALRGYLKVVTVYDTSIMCGSDGQRRGDICHQYAESTDRLVELYHLLERDPNSVEIEK